MHSPKNPCIYKDRYGFHTLRPSRRLCALLKSAVGFVLQRRSVPATKQLAMKCLETKCQATKCPRDENWQATRYTLDETAATKRPATKHELNH